jgi:hypothetical protein
VITPEGINDELGHWLKMTVPGGSFDLNEVELGRPIGRSWVLLLGLIPVDYDDITLVELDQGRGFLERSRMLFQRAVAAAARRGAEAAVRGALPPPPPPLDQALRRRPGR